MFATIDVLPTRFPGIAASLSMQFAAARPPLQWI
jgi:hypothetical protein